MKNVKNYLLCIGLLCVIHACKCDKSQEYALPVSSSTLLIDSSPNRVATGLDIPFERIGTLRPRSTFETQNTYWTIGCETVDRDFTDYNAFKDYLAPLGIHKARFQCGWAKTERVKGQYDFAWLDSIVDDMGVRNVEMWAELSYGNPIYSGGGGIDLGGGLPSSDEALDAWAKWVEAMVTRYKDRIHEWEIWNEADLNAENSAERLAAFNYTTATIIKRVDPTAKIAGLTLSRFHVSFVESFLRYFKERDALGMIDWITFHVYSYNPDCSYGPFIAENQEFVRNYAPHIKLRQGESGCPSEYQVKLSLKNYNWNELTQAKWLLRRMMLDMGYDIDGGSAVFCIMDMVYLYEKNNNSDLNVNQNISFDVMKAQESDKSKLINRKGLILCDSLKQALKIKQSYYAVQNTVTFFDRPMERVKDSRVSVTATDEITAFEYIQTNTGKRLIVYWNGTRIPADTYRTDKAVVTVPGCDFKHPVWVDLLSGRVYAIPPTSYKREGGQTVYELPIYDSPVVITDRSALKGFI